MAGTKGEIDYAVRLALNILDEWVDVTGVVTKFSGYYYELQGIVEAAVHCGFQRALDDEKPLPCEEQIPAPPKDGE